MNIQITFCMSNPVFSRQGGKEDKADKQRQRETRERNERGRDQVFGMLRSKWRVSLAVWKHGVPRQIVVPRLSLAVAALVVILVFAPLRALCSLSRIC